MICQNVARLIKNYEFKLALGTDQKRQPHIDDTQRQEFGQFPSLSNLVGVERKKNCLTHRSSA